MLFEKGHDLGVWSLMEKFLDDKLFLNANLQYIFWSSTLSHDFVSLKSFFKWNNKIKCQQ